MSITKSYNKYTDTYYAYDTTYEWDEKRQKKVQRKRCIGKFDPDTGEIIPTGKVGRPAGTSHPPKNNQPDEPQDILSGISGAGSLIDRCEKIEYLMSELSSEIRGLKDEIDRIASLKRKND